MTNDNNQLKQAQALHQQGNIKQALEIYQTLLSDNPKNTEIMHLIAIAYAQIQEHNKAITSIDQATAIDPKNPVFYNTLGNIYAAMNSHQEAIEHYKKSIEIDPNYYIAYNNIASQYYRINQLDEAESYYKKAIACHQNYADAHYNLALLQIKKEHSEAAIQSLRTLLNLKPKHCQGLYQLGQLLLQSEQAPEAIELINQCLEMAPDNADINHLLGLALYQDEQYEGAIHYLEKTLMLEPQHPEANHNIANAHLKMNNPEIALNYFFKQLEVKPFFESYYNIGVLLTFQERHRDAAQYLQQAIALEPDNIDAQLNLGNLYLKLLSYDKAVLHYTKAQQLKPDDPEIKHILQAISQSANPGQPPEEYTSHLFNQYAPHYDKHLNKFLHYKVPEQLHQAVFEEIGTQKEATIIDLGCGTGLCGEFFASQADKLIGIDLAADMVKIAQSKNIYHEAKVGDIHSLLPTYSHADIILAADVFTYIGDLNKIFKICYQTLNDKGVFAFTVEKGHDQDYTLQQTIRYAHSESYIKTLASEYNFDILRCDNIELRKQKGQSVEGYLVILQK